MWVELTIYGVVNSRTGILENNAKKPLEFDEVKKAFRGYLDEGYDHKLLLNANDPWAGVFSFQGDDIIPTDDLDGQTLPGLVKFDGDPSTENIALEIAEWSRDQFGSRVSVKVQETHVNAATADR